jgi:hypothetical protein
MSRRDGEPWVETVRIAFHVCDSCSRAILRGAKARMRVEVVGKHEGRPLGVLHIEHPACPQEGDRC